jgi:hypothetical protein
MTVSLTYRRKRRSTLLGGEREKMSNSMRSEEKEAHVLGGVVPYKQDISRL